MFFRQIMEAFLVRTEPASSMVKPAHIHITSAPQIRERKRIQYELRLSVDAGRVRSVRPGDERQRRQDQRRCNRYETVSRIR